MAIGVSLVLRCSRPEIAGLAGAAVIASAVITATVLTATGNELDGPGFHISEFGPRVVGSGVIVTDGRDLPAFHEIQIEGPTDVEVTVGGAQSTVLTVDDNIRQHIQTDVFGGKLRIWTDARSLSSGGILRITIPELDGVEIRGSGDAIISGLDGGSFDSRILGSGDIRLAGTVSTHDLQILGSCEIDAASLTAGRVGANIAGSGSVRVDVRDSLDIKIVGSGDLEYSGDPDVDRIVICSGSVRHVR